MLATTGGERLRFETMADMVDGAHAAALDDGLWPAWTTATMSLLGASGAIFGVLDAATGEVNRFLPFGRCEALLEDYAGYWGRFYPHVPLIRGMARPTAYRRIDHIDTSSGDIAAYMDWQTRGSGLVDHLGAATMLDAAGHRGAIVLHRTAGEGGYERTDTARMAASLPDLQRALTLGFRQNRLLDEEYWRGLESVGMAEPALLLDEAGRIVQATAAAEALLSRHAELTVRERRLRSVDPATDARLDATIARAVAVRGASSGAVRVAGVAPNAPILVFHPLPRRRRMLAPFEAATLVRIVLPTQSRPMDAVHRDAFGFTAREAELAALLMADHSIESAAALMGISAATARIHLRRIFEKTGTSRQSDLARLLTRI